MVQRFKRRFPILNQLQQVSSVSVLQETFSGVSSVQDPYGQQLTPVALRYVPRNYANTFLSNPDPANKTLHSSSDSFRYQSPTSREASSGMQSKPGLDESEWSK